MLFFQFLLTPATPTHILRFRCLKHIFSFIFICLLPLASFLFHSLAYFSQALLSSFTTSLLRVHKFSATNFYEQQHGERSGQEETIFWSLRVFPFGTCTYFSLSSFPNYPTYYQPLNSAKNLCFLIILTRYMLYSLFALFSIRSIIHHALFATVSSIIDADCFHACLSAIGSIEYLFATTLATKFRILIRISIRPAML